MAGKSGMVHVRMPVSLIAAVDDAIKKSPRPISRSRFVVEAVERALKKERLLSALAGLSEVVEEEEVPHWKDDEAVCAWLS